MTLQLRKYKDINGDQSLKYSFSAFDSQGQCHINKPVDSNEFDRMLAHYFDNGYDVGLKTDMGQSEELYDILID